MQLLSIIGAGKAGSTIARLFSDKKLLRVNQILNSTPKSSANAVEFIGSGQVATTFAELTPADLWLIGTSDQHFESVIHRLAERKILKEGDIVFHLSGITPSTVLSPLKESGASIASVHPVFSFADRELAVKNYSQVYCGIEGDDLAANQLSELFSAIGSIPFSLDATKKSLYHSGMVFCANYIVTLLSIAENIFEKSGLNREAAREIASSFAMQVAKNVQQLGPKVALTGPLKRGDLATIQKHQAALKELDPELEKLYSQLAAITKRDLC